jgi:hypothetical protein
VITFLPFLQLYSKGVSIIIIIMNYFSRLFPAVKSELFCIRTNNCRNMLIISKVGDITPLNGGCPASTKMIPALTGIAPALTGTAPCQPGTTPALTGIAPALTGMAPRFAENDSRLSRNDSRLSRNGSMSTGSNSTFKRSNSAFWGSSATYGGNYSAIPYNKNVTLHYITNLNIHLKNSL